MKKEYKDYSHEVQPHKSKLIRILLIILGTVCVALGITGVFVPGLPTTPFLLAAAACYAKASERFYNWLMNNRYFGSFIRDWRIHKAIPLRAKIIAVSTIILTMGLSAIFLPVLAVRIGMAVIGLLVIAYLLRFPTKKKETLN